MGECFRAIEGLPKISFTSKSAHIVRLPLRGSRKQAVLKKLPQVFRIEK